MYKGPEPLAAYRMDAIPPPPPAAGGYGPGAPPGAGGPHGSPFALGPTPMPPSITALDAQPSRGGLVALVVGLSAVIAVLIIVVVWALFLR